MKIRKQFQKQVEEPDDKKFSRQISLETETGGRLLLGKSLFGDDSSPPRRTHVGAPATTSHDGGHDASLQLAASLEVHVATPVVPPVDDQFTTVVQAEESNSGSCGDWTLHQDDHNNARRKYARRSLRSAGATLVVQANGYSNPKTAVVAKVIQRRSVSSRGESGCPGDKTGHPSEEAEGSLLHCLYLQLLAAGSEGMTLKEIYASFASQTRFFSLGSNWRDQVKSHLTSNPHFKVVKARYFLCDQLHPPPPPLPPPKAAARSLMDLNDVEPGASRRFVSPDTKSRQVRQTLNCESASPDPSSVVNNERDSGVQTRRKTYERTIEAVLNESAVEFHKTQKLEEIGDNRSTDELSTASRRSSDVAPTTTTPPVESGAPPKKRKLSPTVLGIPGMINIPEPIDFRHTGAVPGSLKAMQARIVAETGIHSGVRCSRKDGSNHHSKWQCPMMAMEGRSLCQHHNFLSERKKARYKKAKRQAAGKTSPSPPHESQHSEEEKPPPPPLPLQDLNKPPSDSVEDEELSYQIEESMAAPRIVRTRSDAHTNGSLAESATNANTTEDMDSETEGEQPLVKSRSVNPLPSVPEPGRQSVRSTRKPRMYLAAKKTAEKTPVVAPAPGKSVKKQSVPLIRPPSIPPLPMLYGVRRKSMKHRPSQSTL